jgi:hypothetical protein
MLEIDHEILPKRHHHDSNQNIALCHLWFPTAPANAVGCWPLVLVKPAVNHHARRKQLLG